MLEAVKISAGLVDRRSVAESPEDKLTTRWSCFDISRDAALRAAAVRGSVGRIKDGNSEGGVSTASTGPLV